MTSDFDFSRRPTLGKVSAFDKVQLAAIVGQKETFRSRSRTHIFIKTWRGIELISLTDVIFFQAGHKYVTVRHEGGEVLIDDTLRDLEMEFGDRVVRIHRNTLVLMNHLEGLERSLWTLPGEDTGY